MVNIMNNAIFSQKISNDNSGFKVAVKDSLKVAIKDSIDVAGYRSMLGSAALENVAVASEHAAVVTNILNAGCQLVGKLNMHEFAFGMTGVNHWSGTPVNPHFPDYIPGGSSSGSAVAVAQAMVDFSLGSDTGGSIRLPAACCGVYGLKPTFGRVSRVGVAPLHTTLDCVGPFSRTIEGIIEAMAIIDSSFKPIEQLTDVSLGVLKVAADPEITTAISMLLAASSLPHISLTLRLMPQAFAAGLTLINTEAWQSCGQYADDPKVGSDVAKRLALAKNATKQQLLAAEQVRQKFNHQVDQLLELVTVLVLPTLPTFPMLRQDALAGKVDLEISALVRPFNLSGHPALSMPITTTSGRPAGVQLIARKGQDELLCQVAKLLSS